MGNDTTCSNNSISSRQNANYIIDSCDFSLAKAALEARCKRLRVDSIKAEIKREKKNLGSRAKYIRMLEIKETKERRTREKQEKKLKLNNDNKENSDRDIRKRSIELLTNVN